MSNDRRYGPWIPLKASNAQAQGSRQSPARNQTPPSQQPTTYPYFNRTQALAEYRSPYGPPLTQQQQPGMRYPPSTRQGNPRQVPTVTASASTSQEPRAPVRETTAQQKHSDEEFWFKEKDPEFARLWSEWNSARLRVQNERKRGANKERLQILRNRLENATNAKSERKAYLRRKAIREAEENESD